MSRPTRSLLAVSALVALLGGGCAKYAWRSPLDRRHPLVGKLYAVAERRFVSFAHLRGAAADATFILLGEKHDNADHHLWQEWLVRILRRGRSAAVVFEMLRPGQRATLDAFLRAHPKDAAGLGVALQWHHSGWPPWALYQPVAEAAMDAGAAIRIGDAEKSTLRRVGKEGFGALGPGESARLALDAPLDPRALAALEKELAESHCGYMPKKAIARMLKVERFRDATLADNLVAASGEREVAFLIAGNGHARRDWAVPFYLAQRVPKKKALVVGALEVRAGETDPAAYARSSTPEPKYDYVFFTPRRDDADPCVKLREQMLRLHRARKAK